MSTTISNRAAIFDFCEAPAPRYLMRLALLEKLCYSLPTPKRFLEIGPGRGDVALFLAQLFPSAMGELIEIGVASTELLTKKLANKTQLEVRLGDFRTMDGKDCYDLLLACEVFEHLEDDREAFEVAHKLLASGGHFLFSAPAQAKKCQFADEYAGHFRRYDRDEIRRKFEYHGIELLTIWSYGFPITNLIRPFTELYYRKKLKHTRLDKGSATINSGVERSVALRFRHIPFSLLMRPFFYLQYLARHTDLGDGYIAVGRKKR